MKNRNYIHRDPDLQRVLEAQRECGKSWAKISHESGVSRSTFTNWASGKTRRPQHLTMKFALQSMGYDFAIVRRSK